MAGVRTPISQYASCVLVDVDDTFHLFSVVIWRGNYVAQRCSIGINAGRIRGINSRIRGGEVQHTGVIPFLKKFEATVKCCTQNGSLEVECNGSLPYLAQRNRRHYCFKKQ